MNTALSTWGRHLRMLARLRDLLLYQPPVEGMILFFEVGVPDMGSPTAFVQYRLAVEHVDASPERPWGDVRAELDTVVKLLAEERMASRPWEGDGHEFE